MIEIDKMLHLRKYMLRTILRSDTRFRVTRSLHRAPLSHESTLTSRNNNEGYVFRYILPSLSSSSPTPTLVLSRSSYTPACMRTFGTTVTQSTVDDIDHRLASLCDMKHEQVQTHRLQEVIKLYEDSDRQIDSNTSMLLLRACANLSIDANTKERQDFVDRAWRLASQSGNSLTLEHYNTLLDMHARNANPVDSEKFLADMSVEPDAKTYHLLLDIAARTGDIGNLKDTMSMIKKRNIALDEEAFATLVQTYMASGNVTEAEHMITLAKDAKVSTNKLYTELAYGYAMLGDVPNLVKILNDEPQSDTSLLRIIVTLSMSNNGRHIPVVLNFLTASIPPAFDSEISKTIKELMRTNRIADAHTIISCLALNKATTSFAKRLVSNFLNDVIIMNVPIEDVTKYASDFVDSGCDPLALSNVAELGLKLGRENLCLAIFAAMKQRGIELRPHFYWPLLVMAHQNQGESKIFSLIKSMMAAGVGLDHDTLINYVFPYVNTANPIITLQRLKMERIPRIILYTPMIVFLMNNNRLQDVLTLCEYSHMKLHYRDLLRPLVRVSLFTQDVNYAKVLTIFPAGHEFVSTFLLLLINNMPLNSNMENVQLLLEMFKNNNVTISLRDANLLKDRLGKFNLYINRNASILDLIESMVDKKIERTPLSMIAHVKYMNGKELECYLVELKNKNMPTRIALRRLLEVYCSENNLSKVEEIKHEYNANEYKWTPGMKMYLFELYLKHDKLNEAEMLLTELQNEPNKILVDNNKVLMFALALIKANRPKSAFDVITNIKFHKSRDTQRHCYQLLHALAQSKYNSYTQDLLRILLNRGYCEISIELLRPLVAIPLEFNDIPSAVNIFSECVQKYRMIPLAQEIFTALLRERDNKSSLDINGYIEKVYNDVLSVKDSETAATFLMIGLATLDKTDELQTLLQNQKFSMTALIHYFHFAQRNNNIDIFYKILKMSNSDSNNLDHNVLCNLILSAYSKTSDCDSALKLWKTMCGKNIKPNKQFIKNFINFLQSNKVPLPPDFEEKSGMYVNRNK